ncbi:hypothetical protein [Microbacterium phyllosphaerae]|uniref:hypothetical protein n=1 Tax=Microbacterium phyllosphaerae TaxID=124798 RepID=UPI00216852FD|nr:hypothetical protein [Microbacterium phyllosphaerae]MCS3442146.1 hypothetical protein [Microbacterium phyllosphaerae]
MPQDEFQALFEAVGLSHGEWDLVPSSGMGSSFSAFELQPSDYVRQAEADLLHETDGANLNAVSNAKRAISCQIDEILTYFGYGALRWDNGRKVRTIASMGITAPRILGKLNATRNLLEHSYRRVTRNEAEDAVDVATLFVAAASPVLRMFPGEFFISSATDQEHYERGLAVDFEYDQPRSFTIQAFGEHPTISDAPATTLTHQDPSFPALIAAALAADRDLPAAAAIDALRQSVSG